MKILETALLIEVPGAGGAEAYTEGKGMSVTMGDYDLDGYLDLFVTNGRGIYPYNNGPDQLYRNISSGNNWLQIDLEGTVSNRDGIGARLFATTPDGKIQLRERNGGIHWSQQDQKRIHFGLAQNEKVSELTIHWPSGIIQKLTDVPVNQVLRVVEDGVQTGLPGDVNRDGGIDILDFLIITAHFGEKPPTDARMDINKDGQIDIEDLVSIIKLIEENQTAAAPTQKHPNQSADLCYVKWKPFLIRYQCRISLFFFTKKLKKSKGRRYTNSVSKTFLRATVDAY